jgi:glycosyltransferase involved in cell wall biosynthesis
MRFGRLADSRNELPTCSLVTPCLNAVSTIEITIQSVLSQGIQGLEYIVADGASSDGTVDVLRRYAQCGLRWTSEPDNGMYFALNKSLNSTVGDIMGWVNADDLLMPGALHTVLEIFRDFPDVDWISSTHPLAADCTGQVFHIGLRPGYSSSAVLSGLNSTGTSFSFMGQIQQESTFWRRRLWERAGGFISTNYRLAADFELWTRFAQCSTIWNVEAPLGCFRHQQGQKSEDAALYENECREIVSRVRNTPQFVFSIFGRLMLQKSYWIIRHNFRANPEWKQEERLQFIPAARLPIVVHRTIYK